MAVTGVKKPKEQQVTQPYQGLQGVSQGTAQQVGQYQSGYQPSQRVTQAQQTLQNIQAAKPQGYNSKYGAQLDSIMNQLQNPQEIKYNFNDDELFKYYADLYTQKGRQASMDTMGQAAALTGGYGNSYAQQAGQQAYQQNLLSLYDRGMDLYDRAYQRHQDNLANLRNNYAMMAQADESDYGRYRDTVADWQREEALAADRAAQAEQMDYGQYRDALEYWSGLAQIENADFRTEQQRQEAIRQYEQDFAEKQRQYNQDFAEQKRLNDRNYAEQVRQFNQNFAEQQRLNDRNYNEQVRQYNQDFSEQQRLNDRNYAEQVRQFNENLALNNREYDERVRQFNENLALNRERFNYDQKTDAQKYAYNICEQILANGKMPSAEQLAAAGISEADARSMMAQMEPVATGTGGGSGGSGGRPKSKDSDKDGDDTGNKNWVQRAFDYAKKKASNTSPIQAGANILQAQTNKVNKKVATEKQAKAYTDAIKKFLK